jgi:RecA/RadA recombinase
MARQSRATGAGVTQAVEARDARDRLAQMGEVAAQFSDFRPRAEVIRNVEAVPTIFPWYDHVTGVGGHPISRFTLVHGPSGLGKTAFCLGLIASFLQRFHFAGLVDAERTTTDAWVRSLMGDLADHQGFSALPVGTYEQVRVGVRNYCETIANARAKGKLSPETSGIIVVDSIRKLVPKKLWDELAKAKVADEDDAKPSRGKRKKAPTGVDGIGGRAGQIKAALNAAWVDELVPLLADTRMAMVVIARETEDPDADVWASKSWKIGGGTALFYEASLDVRVTRGWIQAGDVTVGEKHRLEIHKTKIAGKLDRVPEAWFHVANGVSGHVGFDRPRDVIALGLEIAAIQADGSWIKWGKTTLGQGVESAVARLHKDADLLVRVEDDVRALSAKSRVTSLLI